LRYNELGVFAELSGQGVFEGGSKLLPVLVEVLLLLKGAKN
jgi:hypothetical protein